MRRSCHAFTLAELLVSIAVLTLLVFIASRMVTSATNVTTQANKRMESDGQVRLVLDRMAVDFSQMIRRTDVDCYVKSNLDPETGNDRIALFSTVTGYYPSTGSPSPISLVAYRINGDPTSASLNKMQRMGKGLVWAGVSTTDKPIIYGLQAIYNNWPAATSATVRPWVWVYSSASLPGPTRKASQRGRLRSVSSSVRRSRSLSLSMPTGRPCASTTGMPLMPCLSIAAMASCSELSLRTVTTCGVMISCAFIIAS